MVILYILYFHMHLRVSLQNLLIDTNKFFYRFHKIFYINEHAVCYWRQCFIYCFLIWNSCLIAMARASSTMVHRDGKSRHSCHLDITGKILNNSKLGMMLAVEFFCRYPLLENSFLFLVWGNAFLLLVCWVIRNRWLNLSNAFSVLWR